MLDKHGAARSAQPNIWPWFDEDERSAVQRVMASGKVNYWTGTEGRAFESEYAKAIGVRHAIALANGTVALELALRMLDIGPGDEVIVTPRSFIASVSCVVLQGATPVFADVDSSSGNLTAESIEAVVSPRTRAVIPVHLAGWPCEMDAIMELARAHGFNVIEDCAQAHGAEYRNRSVGSFGHASAFSFCQDKIITTLGEGGLLATDDAGLWERAWSFKDHGKTWDAVYERQHGPGFRWVHDHFGTNWRMTEVQAAVGRLQLGKLGSWIAKRRHNAALLDHRLATCTALSVPEVPAHVQHAYYKYYLYLKTDTLRSGWTRDRVVAEVTRRGVACFAGSCPEIYRERAFAGKGLAPAETLPNAHALGESSVMLQVHPTLTDDDLHRTADVLLTVLDEARQ
ncbi:MAG: DegT/DnrJ/EryC1/StrS aminotransferase family protein [Gammaproteobacteria bacterium]|nr:DegT/DnrJ/EryC1/StrS aminotransferase family protein [Gammaproteobacteria bacterium]